MRIPCSTPTDPAEITGLSPLNVLAERMPPLRMFVGGAELPELRRQSATYAEAARAIAFWTFIARGWTKLAAAFGTATASATSHAGAAGAASARTPAQAGAPRHSSTRRPASRTSKDAPR